MKLLVVDDGDESEKALGVVLSALGHHVQSASDAAGALRAARAAVPDAVFLDFDLRVDVLGLARELRRVPGMAGTPFVAVSGMGPISALAEKADRDGFVEHLTKPVEPARVIDLLAAIA